MITMEQVSAEAGAFDRIEAAGGTEPMLEARERFTVGIDAIFAEFRHALYVVLRDAEKHGRERVEREGVVEAPEVAERRGAALALSVLVAGLGATVNPTTKEGL